MTPTTDTDGMMFGECGICPRDNPCVCPDDPAGTDGLVEDLRLHAYDDCDHQEPPPTHICMIAADRIQSDVKRIAELEGKLAQREEQLAMISASWSNHNAAMMVKLNELAATIEATLGAKP